MLPGMTIPVALAAVHGYEPQPLDTAAETLLTACGFAMPAMTGGCRTLVKPNLVSRSGLPLSCTHPQVVRAVCARLLDRGAKVKVADSPAFGSAASVARAAGLQTALRPLGLRVSGLNRAVRRQTSFGAPIGISRAALEADVIINLPKLKAHSQMRLSAAVKNLFGCVAGLRKAVAHARFGDKANLFEAMILDIVAMLPPTLTMVDAVQAMHRSGPIGGEPFDLGLLAASPSPIALDTALYTLLGLGPDTAPLWREARVRELPGSSAQALDFPLQPLDAFNASGFVVPERLSPVSFAPSRLIKGRLRSLLHRLG